MSTTQDTMNPTQPPTYIIPPPASPNWKMPALVGVLLLLAASNVYLYMQLEHVRTDTKNDMAKLGTDLGQSITQLRLDNNAQLQASRHSAEVLQQQLERQRMIAQREVGAAKDDAEKKVQDLEQRVAAEQTKQAELIGQVKQTAETTSSKLTDVSTDVGTVKTDLTNTKSELETTISNLKRVNGDLDSHASLIATNGKELSALRALGERNYVEFTLPKAKHAQRVGDISLRLEKLDLKKNRFTVEVTADDQVTEKKDRTVNEPIQFYTSKAKQPYEIVVNKVSKDTIVGYLATPKVQNGR